MENFVYIPYFKQSAFSSVIGIVDLATVDFVNMNIRLNSLELIILWEVLGFPLKMDCFRLEYRGRTCLIL